MVLLKLQRGNHINNVDVQMSSLHVLKPIVIYVQLSYNQSCLVPKNSQFYVAILEVIKQEIPTTSANCMVV